MELQRMCKGRIVVKFEVIFRNFPTDGASTLLWWCGSSAPETLRTMPAVA
jgi:hypothetical protein